MDEHPKVEAVEGITFDDPESAISFRVNPERRTISGVLVPWAKVAKSGFAKWRFHPGSLRWSDASRIKLNLSHDHKDAVGVANRLQNGPVGLEGTFKIARGVEGDRALSLAEDRVLDGFSIEVDFEDEDGWMPDPDDEEVRLVKSGRLGGVALTAFPAFDDARVDRVAAMKEKEMTEDKQGDKPELTTDDPEVKFDGMLQGLANKIVDSQQKLNAEMAQSVGESISEGVKTALESIGDPQRGAVKAARYTVTREEPVYRFDGTGDSLVRDAWYASTAKDEDAIARLRKYKRQTEEVATLVNQNMLSFAPQTTTTASQVIPPGYRPELYVPMLQQERPFVSAASNGTIANATPFTVPTFTSVTTGSADHVEGTNPSDGSLSFGTKTVTPQAVSGRLVLSREVIDASNPAIDQIALAAMREAYNRQTEVKVYTLLNGANGSGGTITAGFVPSGAQAVTVARGTDNQGLVAQIRSSLASYTFARFAQPTLALMGPTATGYLAAALDTMKRPLFPYIGPYNSVGTGNAVSQGWQVDGLNFIPAWGATGTAAGDTQIFILNRADLWVWESPLLQFRFEEKQGPANIELNIFGYFATHLLRPVGLSGIRIT
jgi:HK97 family phage prohead protease